MIIPERQQAGKAKVTVYRPLGPTPLKCAPLGFGGYRIARARGEHRLALQHYLALGGNLIDTSANYGLGDSELLCGEVLRDVDRDAVIVVTKAGYIQGQNKITAKQQGYPEIVEFAPDVWHCMHPAFLRDQFDLSCARLGLKRIDVFLLHNPEYFLKDAEQRRRSETESHVEFYRRVTAAFECLEELVAQGRLSWYGISSNTFGTPEGPEHVSLEKCLKCAQSVSAEHHFRVAQLPLNLLETGPALLKVETGRTALECAKEAGLAVLTNRPLNAIVEGQLVRLADQDDRQDPPGAAAEALSRLAQHEKDFREQFDFPLLAGGMGTAGWLSPLVDHLPSLEEFRTAIAQAFTPATNTWLLNADRTLQSEKRYSAWRAEFGARLDATIAALQNHTARGLHQRARAVRRALEGAGLPPSQHTLSQLALATLLNLPGVSCVLNGMRTPAYVDDSLGALGIELPDAKSLLEKLGLESIFDSPRGL